MPNQKPISKMTEFDIFFERTGLAKKWVCDQLHAHDNTLHPRFGFPENLARDIEQIIQNNGKSLQNITLSQNAWDDLQVVHKRHGVKLVSIAQLFNYDLPSQLAWICKRDTGLTTEQKKTIEKHIKNIGKEMAKFKIPSEMIRRRAA